MYITKNCRTNSFCLPRKQVLQHFSFPYIISSAPTLNPNLRFTLVQIRPCVKVLIKQDQPENLSAAYLLTESSTETS